MRNLLIALVLLVTALTFYSALWFKSTSIEEDITQRVTDELDATNAVDVDVDVDGRHVTLTGVVYDEATEAAHLQTADQTYGALGPIDGLTYLSDGGYVTAVKDPSGITLRGTVPNEDVRATLIANAQSATDGSIDDQLVISGPAADWQSEAAFGVAQMSGLESGTLTAATGVYALSGSTDGNPDDILSALADRDGWQSVVTSPSAVRGLSDDVSRLNNDIAVRDATISGLEDTVAGQSDQIETLTAQRDTADSDLESLRASLTSGESNIANLQSELDTTKADLLGAQDMIQQKDETIAANLATIEGLNNSVAGFETELANRQNALGATDQQVVSLRGELDLANQSNAELVDQIADRDQTIANITGIVADRDATIATLTEQADERDTAVAGLEAQVADRDQTIAGMRESALASESDQVAALNGQIAERDGTIERLNAQVADTAGEVDRLETELADTSGQVAELGANVATLTSALGSGENQIETLQGSVAELTAVVGERDATIAAMQTPATSVDGMNPEQCAAQANAALEGAQINFDTSTATIQGGSVPLLERLTGIALACVGEGGLTVEIGGHTDSQGTDENNQVLSEARAEAVLGFMASRGVPTDGLRAVGYGETQPIGDNETAEGRAANRRISFEWQAR